MATKIASKQPWPENDYPNESHERIVIERREIVGEVIASMNGTKPMVVAAFERAGEYLNELASEGKDPARLEFEYRGARFVASYNEEG